MDLFRVISNPIWQMVENYPARALLGRVVGFRLRRRYVVVVNTELLSRGITGSSRRNCRSCVAIRVSLCCFVITFTTYFAFDVRGSVVTSYRVTLRAPSQNMPHDTLLVGSSVYWVESVVTKIKTCPGKG